MSQAGEYSQIKSSKCVRMGVWFSLFFFFFLFGPEPCGRYLVCIPSCFCFFFGFSGEQEGSVSSAAFQFIPACTGCSLPSWKGEEISLQKERKREIHSTWWYEEWLWRWLYYLPVLKSCSCPDARNSLLGIWRGP